MTGRMGGSKGAKGMGNPELKCFGRGETRESIADF